MAEAIALLHQPPASVNTQTILEGHHPAQLRLASEELIAHQISMLSRRARTLQLQSARAAEGGKIAEAIIETLPFSLTGAQKRVCSEIVEDLKKPTPMLRLLQGDVGSGKTLVAAISAAHMVEAGHQVALMAPTELLSEQHFRGFNQWFEPLGVKVLWLTGQIKGKARREALTAVEEGEVDIVVGTHAFFRTTYHSHHLAWCWSMSSTALASTRGCHLPAGEEMTSHPTS